MENVSVKNQRVGSIKNYKLEDLAPFQGELKVLSDEAYEKLKTSFLKHGVIAPVFVWNNNILDGHQRVYTLMRMREEGISVPSKIKGVQIEAEDEKEAKVFLLQYVSQHGQINVEGLRSFIDDAELTSMLGELDTELMLPGIDLDTLFDGLRDPGEEANTVPSVPKDAKSKPGDVYELGRHRVVCGDCKNPETVDILFDGKTADCLLTDPPYGVNYSDKNEFLNKIDKGNRIQTPIENDNIEDYRQFFTDFLSLVPFSDYNVFYIFMLGMELHNLRMAIEDCDLKWGDYLVWVKNNHVLGRKDYSAKHEFILYGWSGKHKFYGGFKTAIIEANRLAVNDLHPTMKPVSLLQELITDGTKPNMVVYDAFLGSGSTLIACEQTNRSCYGIELQSNYVDVIVTRYVNHTGDDKIRLNGKQIKWGGGK